MRAYLTLIPLLIGLSSYGQSNVFPTSGNVGIGTTAPAANLNIVSAPNSTISAIKIGKANDPGKIEVPYGEATGGYNIDFAAWRDGIPDYIGARIRGERMNLWENNSALVQSMDLVFSTGGPASDFPLSEQLRIKFNGNIGIGTNNPQEKLAVKGKIRAEEIKVTTAAADWPDYVFEENYKLPNLVELEAYLKTNKHLPEIPTAKEVESNGIELGDMISKLLKKNEELTLHAIENEKKRQALEEKVLQLEKILTTISDKKKIK
ncbi:MAG: tail fiber protein [Sphingobacterium sp.]|nr:tail fiber protein [Sphingobacterium sp.]